MRSLVGRMSLAVRVSSTSCCLMAERGLPEGLARLLAGIAEVVVWLGLLVFRRTELSIRGGLLVVLGQAGVREDVGVEVAGDGAKRPAV